MTITAFHASDRSFDRFAVDLLADDSLGFHFAETYDLAINAAIKAGRRAPAARAWTLEVRNPIRVRGLPNGFSAFRLLDAMVDDGILTPEVYNRYMDAYDEIESEHPDEIAPRVNALMRSLLGELGADAFEYRNEFDAGLNFTGTGADVQPALSWIVLDPDLAKPLMEMDPPVPMP